MKTNSKWLVGALIGLHFTDLQAADWSPGAEQAFASGSRHFESGDYDRALEQFRIAMEEGMRTVPVIYNIGVCQYRIGDYAGSELSFRRIALEYPDWYHLAQYNIGLALIRQDRIEEAGRAFHEARNSDDTSVI
ncbi:MAG TPA: tetratricopeptide repeat protein, partial [Woeseiaceae bacterium]|nr:tetratricopeptide repeat protein [Woeseiaceae bacterium]